MEKQQQPNKSTVSVKSIKLAQLNFIQKSNLINKEDTISLDLGINASYQKIKSESFSIQFNFGIQLKLLQKDNNNEITIGVIQAHVIGLFDYDNNLDKSLFPNLASILYSYLRPIVAQISVMAKLPPIDLPILNLSKIKVDEIIEE